MVFELLQEKAELMGAIEELQEQDNWFSADLIGFDMTQKAVKMIHSRQKEIIRNWKQKVDRAKQISKQLDKIKLSKSNGMDQMNIPKDKFDCSMCKFQFSTGMASISRCELRGSGMFMTCERNEEACSLFRMKKSICNKLNEELTE